MGRMMASVCRLLRFAAVILGRLGHVRFRSVSEDKRGMKAGICCSSIGSRSDVIRRVSLRSVKASSATFLEEEGAQMESRKEWACRSV